VTVPLSDAILTTRMVGDDLINVALGLRDKLEHEKETVQA
jgi:hypothetical protein